MRGFAMGRQVGSSCAVALAFGEISKTPKFSRLSGLIVMPIATYGERVLGRKEFHAQVGTGGRIRIKRSRAELHGTHRVARRFIDRLIETMKGSVTMPTPTGHTTAIRATRVNGTTVYNTAGEKIGEIEDIVLDKMSNKIHFAVVGFGGFLGIGEKYHPVPWPLLDYVEDRSGYVVPFTKEQLEAAPAGSISELTKNDAEKHRVSAYNYYGVDSAW